MGRAKGMMSEETFTKVIADVKDFKPQINLHHSGESFIHKKLFEFIRHARENDLTIGMTTNGTLLDRDDFGILETDINHLNISLSGVDEEDYRTIKVKDEYEKVRNNVVRIAAEKLRRGSKTRLIVNVTQNAYNIKKIDDFRREYESIPGIDGVLVRGLMDWGGSVDIGHLKPDKTLRQILRNVKKSILNTISDTVTEPICEAPGSYGAVLWDGTIVPCCLDFNGELGLGNIHDGHFLDLWNGPEMQELRDMMTSVSRTRRHPVCGPCMFGTKAKPSVKTVSLSVFRNPVAA